ncbi:MAG: hypothetical protein H6673_13565 [Anaerolineales bacterium]|nr:hypothetical protein [Anaerolineales bacterium]
MSKKLLLLILCGVLFVAPVMAQDDPSTIFAWLLNGELWIADETHAEQPLALNTILHASLSPDRTMLAYVTAGTYPPPELIIMDVRDNTLVQHLSSTIFASPEGVTIEFSAPVWGGNEAVLFNTVEVYGGLSGAHNRYDVQRLDVQDGSWTELLPAGEGGDMVPSPDDQWVAIRQAGRYGPPNEAGFVQIISAATGDPLTERFMFPAVATASEIVWLPSVHWDAASNELLWAIPDPDAVYLLDDAPPAQLCRFKLGSDMTCSALAIAYPADVVVNPDLTQVAYLYQRQLLWGPLDGERQSIEVDGLPIAWLDDATLIYQRYTEGAGLYRADTHTLWEPTGQPVINMQALEDGRWLLAVGNYTALTIGLFDPANTTFNAITALSGGYPIFAER